MVPVPKGKRLQFKKKKKSHVLKCARAQYNKTGKFWKITDISKRIGKKSHRISKMQHDQIERMLNHGLECHHLYFLSF